MIDAYQLNSIIISQFLLNEIITSKMVHRIFKLKYDQLIY